MSNYIDETDRTLIKLTQSGLPLVARPYDAIAEQAGIPTEEVIDRLKNMLASGVIRRIGAVPNHYALGLRANGMSVWDVTDEEAVGLGAMIGQLEFVSHCYLRPRHLPQWPYNLFAMVHGKSREEVVKKAKTIEFLLGSDCRSHDILYSSRILKKTGLRLVG